MAKKNGDGGEGSDSLSGDVGRVVMRVLMKQLVSRLSGGWTKDGSIVKDVFTAGIPELIGWSDSSEGALQGAVEASYEPIRAKLFNRWAQVAKTRGISPDEPLKITDIDLLAGDDALIKSITGVIRDKYAELRKEQLSNPTLARLEKLLGSRLKVVWRAYKTYLKDPSDADVDPKGEKTPDERAEAKKELKSRYDEIVKGEQKVSFGQVEAFLDRFLDDGDVAALRKALNNVIKFKEEPKGKAAFESLTGIKVKDLQSDPGKVLKNVFGGGKAAAATRELKHAAQRSDEYSRRYAIEKSAGPMAPAHEEDDLRARFWLVRLWRWLKNLF